MGEKGSSSIILFYQFVSGTVSKALLAFSIYTNTAKILDTKQPAGSLTALNGVRFISMTWVILGHVFAFSVPHAGMIYMKFPTMWYVRPAKPQISLRIRAV